MIKKHLLKTILTATVVATLLTATACESKQTSDNTTVQQTTEAVKVVSNVDVKTEAEKPNEEADKPKEEADKQPEEAKEEQIEQPEENAEAVNTEAEASAGEVNEAQNIVSEEEQAAPAEQPAEAPAENNNAGAVDTTPEEQPAAPAAPAAPAEPSPVPEPTPEPVVTPQEPAKPSVTQEQQLVATGKWTKIMEWNDGAECRVYEYKDDITGYSVRASFADGEFYLEQWNSLEEEKAIYSAHGITDNVVSFDRLMKLSNS